MRVLIGAGASGGHVYPALATAEVLRSRGHDVAFAGGDRLEADLVPKAGFAFHPLPVRRPPSVRIELVTPRGIRSMASIARSTWLARRVIARLRPDVVLGMGGFAAVPVTLAAASRRVPLVLHEQNARLSLAQRIPMRWAAVLALSLPMEDATHGVRTELVGNPIRARVAALASLDAGERLRRRAEARVELGLDPSATTLLVFGGSLGSGRLNDVVPTLRLPAGTQVLHLTGPGRDDGVREAWERSGVTARVLGYLDAIQDAYLSADLCVSRSGASAVAELALAALPAVLVPLPTLARGDQDANARVLERAGAAAVVVERSDDFMPWLQREISALLADATRRGAMSAAARSLARPDAAGALATLIESLV